MPYPHVAETEGLEPSCAINAAVFKTVELPIAHRFRVGLWVIALPKGPIPTPNTLPYFLNLWRGTGQVTAPPPSSTET